MQKPSYRAAKVTIKKKIFWKQDEALLDEIGETILPTTPDSPGAKDANIGKFMKVYVSDCYTEEDQQIFKEGFAKINEAADKKYNKEFHEIFPAGKNMSS